MQHPTIKWTKFPTIKPSRTPFIKRSNHPVIQHPITELCNFHTIKILTTQLSNHHVLQPYKHTSIQHLSSNCLTITPSSSPCIQLASQPAPQKYNHINIQTSSLQTIKALHCPTIHLSKMQQSNCPTITISKHPVVILSNHPTIHILYSHLTVRGWKADMWKWTWKQTQGTID